MKKMKDETIEKGLETKVVLFKDSEFGDENFLFIFEKSFDFDAAFDFVEEVLNSMDLNDGSTFEEKSEEFPELTQEIYDAYMKVFDYGNALPTTDRICELLQEAFGLEYRKVYPDRVCYVD